MARDSLITDEFIKDCAHSFARFHRGKLFDSVCPVRMSEECPCKDAGTRTNSAEALTKDFMAENAEHILDNIDGVRKLSSYLLTDILESFGRIRWTSACNKDGKSNV